VQEKKTILCLNWQNEDKNMVCLFFRMLNLRAHALQSELSKVSIYNYAKFKFQSMSLKIKQAFEKINKIYHQNRAKKAIY
jgi:hypothetical protein